jgi:hypothetical protein
MNAWKWSKGYKIAYVSLIVANLAIIYAQREFDHPPYIFAIGFLLANIASWWSFSAGKDLGVVAELTLSIGRMIAVLACAGPLWLSDLIIWLSPVGFSVWVPLLEFSRSGSAWSWTNRLTWWTCCAVLLGLETAYLHCLIQLDSNRDSVPSTLPPRASGDSALA